MLFNTDKIHFIVGHHCVGKSYLSQALKVRNDNILFLECGPTIRTIHMRSRSPLPFREWEQANELRYGQYFTELAIFEEFKKHIESAVGYDTLMILGARSMKNIRYFMDGLSMTRPSIIFIDSVFHLQKSNYEKRECKNISDNDFSNLIKRDDEMGLNEVKIYVEQNPCRCKLLLNDDNDTDRLLDQLSSFITNFDKD